MTQPSPPYPASTGAPYNLRIPLLTDVADANVAVGNLAYDVARELAKLIQTSNVDNDALVPPASVAAGWSASNRVGRKNGKMLFLSLLLTRTGGDIAVAPGTGDIATDPVMLTLPAGNRPVVRIDFDVVYNNSLRATCVTTTDGVMRLAGASIGQSVVASGSTFRINTGWAVA